jgi:hypothetical protein
VSVSMVLSRVLRNSSRESSKQRIAQRAHKTHRHLSDRVRSFVNFGYATSSLNQDRAAIHHNGLPSAKSFLH